ncbi:MAG: LysM peptidoglycan-binding domain-containing protein [Treponema sp.]|nr:LysM peptidoglycan-binding domain-containing protein [Treponema sp.]MCL2273238.1 LysM peptidoglycan-binding domain-containing protein [Treponema sp.]
MASDIGIKIANGEFYPIMEENSLIKKRLILTTVHDNQPSVQIDLFRSATNAMTDAQYIGSLVVENIKPRPKKEPSIEMVISSDGNGKIIADAVDLDTSAGGEHYELAVSLKSLDETTRDIDLPDFELEANEEPPSGLYNAATKVRDNKKKSFPVWLVVLIGLLLILGLLAFWLFYLGGLKTVNSFFDKSSSKPVEQIVPPEPVKQPDPAPAQIEPVKQPETIKQPDPVPVIQAPVTPPPPRPQTPVVTPPPAASYNVPTTIPREGVNYKIRWGDTLWDISETFYRDPWQYPRIAQYNNIRNPNLIISGRTIRIPPRN